MTDETCGILFFLVFGFALIAANVIYYRELAKMTPQQRAKFEEEIRDDLRVW